MHFTQKSSVENVLEFKQQTIFSNIYIFAA